MVTKTEGLYNKIKTCTWEYGIARYLDNDKYRTKDNLNRNLKDNFVGYIIPRDVRDRHVIKYACPIFKKVNEKGKLLSVEMLTENRTWELITRKQWEEENA